MMELLIRVIRRLICMIAITFAGVSFSFAQAGTVPPGFITDNPMISGLDSSIQASMQRYFLDKKAVGVSIGIVLNNKIFFYNYGETKAGNGKLPGNRTIFEIGSITKTFTGILLAQAIVDKKINLDDDIRKYLKDSFPNLEYDGVPIRIRHLANHTSRITRIFPNMWERPEYDSLNPLKGYTRQLLYQGLHHMKMDTMPGIISSYSNMAVALLGTILEDVYGQSYYSLVSKYILVPFNMKDTRVNLDKIPASAIAWPHNEKRQLVPFWDIAALPAMGALRSTTADIVKFINANLAEATPAIALSHQLSFGTGAEGLGLNWFIHSGAGGRRILEHGGGTGGSRSSLVLIPELHSGFVILTNSLANRKDLEKELTQLLMDQHHH